jgi:hypothetical protein
MGTEQALDNRARRAAHRAGYIARKTRRRCRPGFMLLDQRTGACIAGSSYDLSAQEVLEWLAARESCAGGCHRTTQGGCLNGCQK